MFADLEEKRQVMLRSKIISLPLGNLGASVTPVPGRVPSLNTTLQKELLMAMNHALALRGWEALANAVS